MTGVYLSPVLGDLCRDPTHNLNHKWFFVRTADVAGYMRRMRNHYRELILQNGRGLLNCRSLTSLLILLRGVLHQRRVWDPSRCSLVGLYVSRLRKTRPDDAFRLTTPRYLPLHIRSRRLTYPVGYGARKKPIRELCLACRSTSPFMCHHSFKYWAGIT